MFSENHFDLEERSIILHMWSSKGKACSKGHREWNTYFCQRVSWKSWTEHKFKDILSKGHTVSMCLKIWRMMSVVVYVLMTNTLRKMQHGLSEGKCIYAKGKAKKERKGSRKRRRYWRRFFCFGIQTDNMFGGWVGGWVGSTPRADICLLIPPVCLHGNFLGNGSGMGVTRRHGIAQSYTHLFPHSLF